jgi:hypothetical protein
LEDGALRALAEPMLVLMVATIIVSVQIEQHGSNASG